jgi:putative aldouronate transport system substrate-binding protein
MKGRSMFRITALVASVLGAAVFLAGCKGKAGDAAAVSEGSTYVRNAATEAALKIAENPLNAAGEPMYPVSGNKVTMSMAVLKGLTDGSYDTLWFWQSYEKKTNIHWDITQIDSSVWAERKTVMIASDDYPDVFWGPTFTNSEIMNYGKDGIFIPLNGLIDQYGVNLKHVMANDVPSGVDSAIKAPDGNIYSLPYFILGSPWSDMRLWLHDTWVEALGMSKPETLDEFYETLLAFKQKDPNGNGQADEIPWSGSWEEGPVGNTAVLNALGFVTNGDRRTYIAMKDGQAVFMPLHQNFRTYLEFMKKCWDAGLIDPDMFTQTTTQYRAKSITNVVGFSSDAAPFVMTGYETTYLEYGQLKPLVAKKGTTPVYWHQNDYGIGFMEITDHCKTPDLAMRWADILYSYKEAWIGANGPVYQSEDDPDQIGWYIDEEANTTVSPSWWGVIDEALAAKVNPDGLGPWEFLCNKITPRNRGTPWYMGVFDAYGLEKGFGVIQTFGGHENAWRESHLEAAAPYFTYGLPLLFFSDNDTAVINELMTPLTDYVKSMEAKFITGAENLANYDRFIAELKRLGAEKIDSIYRTTVARALQ